MSTYLTVHELSEKAGLSIRTLHYYDQIGLLVPAKISENGYRLYDEVNIKKLQSILLFREMEFPLKDIKKILDSPSFDQARAIDDQIVLLKLKRDHLDDLIDFANRIKRKGNNMDFEVFDKSKMKAYEELAKKTWGETSAYKEYEEKAAKTTDTEKRAAAEKLMDLFFEFGNLKNLDPKDDKVQLQVKKLQDFITANYYTCTNQILEGLGQMYIAGGEMTQNIDVAGGKGTAEFVAKAIAIYCE